MGEDDIVDKFKDVGMTEDELNEELQKQKSNKKQKPNKKQEELARKYRGYRRPGDTIETGPLRKFEYDFERILLIGLGIPATIGFIAFVIWVFLN